jgi:predicted dehydrogenase
VLFRSLAALAAGLWVYSEKPVADTLAGIEEIAEAERRTGRQAWYTPARFRGGVGILAKQRIERGELGELYRVDISHFRQKGRPGVDMAGTAKWFADSRKAITGITGDMGFYFFDQALYLAGWPAVTAVSAMTYKEFPFELPPGMAYDVEEHVVLLARTAGKLTLTFEFANIAHHPWGTTLMVLGTKGGILNDDEKKFRFLTEEGGQSTTHSAEAKDDEGQDTRAYKALAACAQEQGQGQAAATTTAEVLRLHELAQMAFLSAKERREVRPADLDHRNHILWNDRR